MAFLTAKKFASVMQNLWTHLLCAAQWPWRLYSLLHWAHLLH